jgi:hypothetical protein
LVRVAVPSARVAGSARQGVRVHAHHYAVADAARRLLA